METENGGYRMSSVKRVYVEKKPEYAVRAKELQSDLIRSLSCGSR